MASPVVDWRVFLPSSGLFGVGFLLATPACEALCAARGWKVSRRTCMEVAHSFVSYVFALTVVPAALRGLFVTAPPNFAERSMMLQSFPHASFTLWWSVAYFAYDVVVQAIVFRDPTFLAHALFSGGGALLAALAPRNQNMYLWCVGFNEISTICGLSCRSVMIKLDRAKHHPEVVQALEMSFFSTFFLFRIGVMVPRYLMHIQRLYEECSGAIPGVRLPTSLAAKLSIGADAMVSTLSTMLNLYWGRLMWKKMRKEFAKMKAGTGGASDGKSD